MGLTEEKSVIHSDTYQGPRQLWLHVLWGCSPGQRKPQLFKYRSSSMMAVEMGMRKCGIVRRLEVLVGRVWELECTPWGGVTWPP